MPDSASSIDDAIQKNCHMGARHRVGFGRPIDQFRKAANPSLRGILFALMLSAAAANPLVGARPAKAQSVWQDPSPHRALFINVEERLQLEVLDWGGSGRAIVLL